MQGDYEAIPQIWYFGNLEKKKRLLQKVASHAMI